MRRFMNTVGALALIAGATPALAVDPINWDMQSTYPGSLTQLGTLGRVIEERIAAVSGGAMRIRFQEPGAIVPALEAFDAISTGAVQAGWSTPGYWTGKDTTFALFAAVPFGPAAPEYYAWFRFGGGKELFDEIYAQYNIKSVMCAIIAPEAAGWFQREINSPSDFEGMRIRFFGLGARVMEKMGASTQLLAAGDIFPALELGTIDATEFSMPAIDYNLGFYQVAKHYYFPGWHQQSTMFDLMINLDEWNDLTEQQQAIIETVCEANIAYGLAEGEALQPQALANIEAQGVTIHTLNDEILEALSTAWDEVVAEESATNANFKRVWDHLSAFRESYALWREVGYLR
ncbi:MAG: TRAP transporter substrate-binding protein [Rhodobacteraceae bacterium]|nr:MAG: TRAP transporter substrate-binding protein [Paracoccaceae bacterium]